MQGNLNQLVPVQRNKKYAGCPRMNLGGEHPRRRHQPFDAISLLKYSFVLTLFVLLSNLGSSISPYWNGKIEGW